jgi:uncharacterized membrane protein
MDELRNATYYDVVPVPVTLVDGRFEGDDTTSHYSPRLTVVIPEEPYVTGDLTGDGVEEAVVLLAVNFGGSGVFSSLAVLGTTDGMVEHLASIELGDRPKLEHLVIADGELVADLVTHGPDDPMCCPTQVIQRRWRLEDGQVIETVDEALTQDGRFRGQLVWGHENRSFTECGEERTGWVVNEVGDELVSVYDELTSAPYQPMFVEVRGVWGPAPHEGFGADYDESLRMTELLRAEGEGFGCRLDLDDVLYIASGNEPSWRLEIRSEGMTLRTMSAPDGTGLGPPRRSDDGQAVVFEADGSAGAARVTIERRRCADSMSGARYEFAATAQIGESRFQGCALQGL